jgi:hypothetical protein
MDPQPSPVTNTPVAQAQPSSLDGIHSSPEPLPTLPAAMAVPTDTPPKSSRFMDFLTVVIVVLLAAAMGWWLAYRDTPAADGAASTADNTATVSSAASPSPSPSTSSSINPLDR